MNNLVTLTYLKDDLWEVHVPLFYELTKYQTKGLIVIPKGFVTDLASVPRIFWAIFPPFGKYARAAIIHDYMAGSSSYTKDEAHRVFRDVMLEDGVPEWIAQLFYLFVEIFDKK